MGKNENGIKEPVKAKIKLNTQGVGHITSEYKWWEDVYNKAANNLDIDTNPKGVKMSVKDTEAVEIHSTKTALTLSRLKKQGHLKYGSFIKTSTLEDGTLSNDPHYKPNILNNLQENPMSIELNDEELLKACGGRTAHKGARHGLKCNGKLARIERQEAEALAKVNSTKITDDWVKIEKKKKKRKHLEKMETGIESTPCAPIVSTEIEKIITNNEVTSLDKPVSKKTKRKAKRQLENLTHALATTLDITDEPPAVEEEIKKRKHKRKHVETTDTVENPTNETVKKKRKKNKKELKIVENTIIENTLTLPLFQKIKESKTEAERLNDKIVKKKKNKLEKKQKKRIDELTETLMDTLDLKTKSDDSLPVKKKKKKAKKVTIV